MFVITSTESVI